LGRLWLIEPEVDALIALYKDPDDPDRVCWRTFEDDIDRGTISYNKYKVFNGIIYSESKFSSYFNYRIFFKEIKR